MEVIFLIGAVQATFFSILIFNKKEKIVADKILGTWLAILGLHQFFSYLVYNSSAKFVYLGGADAGVYLLHAVLLHMYVETVISRKNKFDKKLLWNLIPVVASYTLFLSYFLQSSEYKLAVYHGKIEISEFVIFAGFILLLAFIYFVIKSVRLLNNHKKNLMEEFSFSETIDLSWLRNLIYSMLLMGGLCVILFIALYFSGISIYYTDFSAYLMLTIFIFALGFWGYKQGKIFNYKEIKNERKRASNTHSENEKSVSAHKIDENLISQADKLKSFIENEKPYLEPKLSLYQLASAFGTTSHQLSFILNNILECNFFEFINSYRVEEVKKRLAREENKQFTIFAIALDCGFNSKASFNRIFKNITGKTPSEYQKSL